MEDFEVREEHWVIADLIGKGKHIRTVPVPVWTKRVLDEWTDAAKIDEGAIFQQARKDLGRRAHTESHLAHRQIGCETCGDQESRSA
jgi:hypothetical protein